MKDYEVVKAEDIQDLDLREYCIKTNNYHVEIIDRKNGATLYHLGNGNAAISNNGYTLHDSDDDYDALYAELEFSEKYW